MNWEVVSGVTGLVSAVCAVVSLLFLGNYSKSAVNQNEEQVVISKSLLMAFLLICSGWALTCLSFLWLAEPYGAFVSDDDYKNFFGFVIALPSGIILLYGLNLLQVKKGKEET